MLEPELKAELDKLHAEVQAAYTSAEKTRKYIFWTIVGSALLIIVPLFFLPFAVNSLLGSYSTALNF